MITCDYDQYYHRRVRGLIVSLSLLVAMMLAILPLPYWARDLRPEWVLLTLIFWSLEDNPPVGLCVSWLVGLYVDVLLGSLLGLHALLYCCAVCLLGNYRKQLTILPIWQQMLFIFIVLVILLTLQCFFLGWVGLSPSWWRVWLSSLTSGLLWPWLVMLLSRIQGR